MFLLLSALIIEVAALEIKVTPVTPPLQNVCCVLPTGQQCCSPTANIDGRPVGCGC